MHTLLLRLVAPLQAWGLDSNFDVRRTAREPTKSAIIGMLGAAMGWTRDQTALYRELSENLRFGVRVDKEGALLRDYQTVKGEKDSYVTERFYLSDAKFLVGLEGQQALLQDLDYALRYPYFQPYLGRRSCPPTGRLSLGIMMQKSLEDALQEAPLLHHYHSKNMPTSYRILTEPLQNSSGQYFQYDQVASFSKERREFLPRPVNESSIPAKSLYGLVTRNNPGHDPLAALEMED